MKNRKNSLKIGLIYTTDKINQPLKCQTRREKAGLITGMTPRRTYSLGKIVCRPCTPRKMSIEVQTMDFLPDMSNLAQTLFCAKTEENTLKEKSSNIIGIKTSTKSDILRVADFKSLSEEASALSKTIRSKCQNAYGKQNKNYGTIKIERLSKPITSNQKQASERNKPSEQSLNQGVNPEEKVKKIGGQRKNRQQKLSMLSAAYQKNLERYESSKKVLGDLLKQKSQSK